MSAYRFCRTGRHRAARRRAESLLGAVLSRRAADDAGRVQAVDPRPAGLVQQLHGRLLGLRPDRRPDRRQAAVRDARPQDRRPSRSSAAGSRPSPARLARLEARDSRPAANRRRSPRDARRRPASCSAPADTSRKRVLTDYVLQRGRRARGRGDARTTRRPVRDPRHGRRSRRQWSPREADPQVCWERSVETLTARKDDIAGLAVASDERIEAYLLHTRTTAEIVSLRSFDRGRGARLSQLLVAAPRARHEDLPVPEGPPGGGRPTESLASARLPSGRQASALRGDGAGRLATASCDRVKGYHDIVGDGGSRVLEQVAEQRTRITDGLAGVRHLVAVGSGKGGRRQEHPDAASRRRAARPGASDCDPGRGLQRPLTGAHGRRPGGAVRSRQPQGRAPADQRTGSRSSRWAR